MQFPLLTSLFLHTHQVTVQYPCIPNRWSPLGHIVEQANPQAFVHLGIDYNTHFWKTVLPDREFLVDRYLLAFGLYRFGCIISHELYGSSVVISTLFFCYFQESLFPVLTLLSKAIAFQLQGQVSCRFTNFLEMRVVKAHVNTDKCEGQRPVIFPEKTQILHKAT